MESRGILAGGDFRPLSGRKYNRLPLDGVTRITLLPGKKHSFFPCLPGEGNPRVKGAGASLQVLRAAP